MTGGFFDLRDASDLFGVLVRSLDAYKATRAKKIEDVLLLVLGLAHLREWIAPNYTRGAMPKNNAERFVAQLFEESSYHTVLQLANHAKHQRRSHLPETQSRSSIELFDDRDIPIDSWLDFDEGPASAYAYGDRDLLDLFDAVAVFYQEHWFGRPLSDRLS